MNSETADSLKDNIGIPNNNSSLGKEEKGYNSSESKDILNNNYVINECLEKTDECKLCLMGLNKWVNKNDIIKFLESKEITYKYYILFIK